MSAEVIPMRDPIEVGEPPLEGFEDVPAIMSPAQLAKVLDVSVRTLERWRNSDEGPDYQHPEDTRVYRYYRRDLIAWLENRRPAGGAAGQNK